jgi:hypothetical protein
MRADRWLELHDYFVGIAHGQPAAPDRFDAALREVEQYLIDTLQPQPSEDLDAIDALLKGKSDAK